jgi:NAD(P)-dependent dehydrogenase (short-subunit alcohol dehydrogenase family)
MGNDINDIYVVVGGAKVGGIGIAVSEQLAQGGKVIMTGASRKEVDDGIAYMQARNIDAVALVCDVLEEDDLKQLVKTSTSAGRVKGLVAVTGLTPTCGDWRLIVDVGLLGVNRLVQAFAPVMQAGSSIVLFGSSSPYMLKKEMLDHIDGLLYSSDTDPDFMEKITPFILSAGEQMACNLAYPIAKRGIQLMTRKFAVQLGEEKGVRVNCISPGIADTLASRVEYEASMKTEAKKMVNMVNVYTPLKRMGDVKEMATVIEFLLSDKASFVSGIDLTVDGGNIAYMRMHNLVEQR